MNPAAGVHLYEMKAVPKHPVRFGIKPKEKYGSGADC
jgi:hypothetical protein